jgi:transposase
MGMGRRPQDRQQEFWVATDSLASVPQHVFYDKLNRLLDEAGFDEFVEELCEPFYAKIGRDSIPPGRYFRMLFVGYFEAIDSQRGIAWRCADSLSLRNFLFLEASQEAPDHSSLSRIRVRLPLTVHEQVFAFVLGIARQKKLLDGNQVGVDATTLEANAAMKSIVRRDSGEDWKDYLRRLAEEAGVEINSDDDLRRFDKQRKKQGKKKVSNDEWVSQSDPASRIIKMKDGRTHLGYKAEHVVDLESEYVLGSDCLRGDRWRW